MGRKKLADDDRKGLTFRFRVTADEREAIEAAAAAAKKTSSQWARDVLQKAAAKKAR